MCNGQGEEVCVTVYESSCVTKRVGAISGQVARETICQKLPVEVCGAGCSFEEGPEECREEVISSLTEIPEEVCDINPEKICRFSTKLVPRLTPQNQCTIVPREVCQLTFANPTPSKKTILTKWCLDGTEQPEYQEENADLTFNSVDEEILTEDDVPAVTAPKVMRLVKNYLSIM